MNQQSLDRVRAFLKAIDENAPFPGDIPRELHQLARQVLRAGAASAADVDDAVADLLCDLVARRGQRGSITELLRLESGALLAALRKRVVQVRAASLGSKSRLVKTLRSHVAAALEAELPACEAPPLTLIVGDRLSGHLVRQAVGHLLARADGERSVRELASELVRAYFTDRADDVRAAAHGEGDPGPETEALRRVDAERHLDQLRDRLGPELARAVGLRAQGRTLAEIGRASTVHERLGKAVATAREHVREHELTREDLEPVLRNLAA